MHALLALLIVLDLFLALFTLPLYVVAPVVMTGFSAGAMMAHTRTRGRPAQ